MNVLVACEFSGIVRDAFIERGHAAISVDLLPSERPGPHYTGDIFDFLDRGKRVVIEVDGTSHDGKEAYDAERDAIMRAAGYRVIRIGAWEVPHILQQVARWRAEAA